MSDHHQLLAEFVQTGSDTAFRELVVRYINFVYSTALRLMDGDSHLAEDVTQTVFIHLAKNAGKLSAEPMLGGWLHRDTCFVASKLRRGEQRRQAREQEAALMNSLQDHSPATLEQLAPILDDAINQLGNEDRNAIVLRFYEQRNFQAVGTALGSNEDAARMRVTRALEKLHNILQRRGIALSATALGTVLATGTVSATPTGLIGTVTGAALAGTTSAATTATFLQAITMAKMKTLMAAPILVAGISGFLLVQNHHKLRERDAELRVKDNQIAQLQLEMQQSNLSPEPAPVTDSTRELLQLRGEVGVLKKQLADALANKPKSLQEVEHHLNEVEKKFMADMLRQQYLTRMKATHAKHWMLGFIMHANDHGGRLPTNFSQAASYLKRSVSEGGGSQSDGENDTLLMATNEFDIVYSGSLNDLPSNRVIVFSSSSQMKIPGDPSGGWTKIYAFADGSVQVVQRDDGNFDDWEKENMAGGQPSAPAE